MPARIYLGAYEWRERISSKTGLPSPPGEFGWRMPIGATHALDLRTSSDKDPLAPPSAKAIFVTPEHVTLPAPFILIATDPNETLTSARRRGLQALFGDPAVVSTRLADVVWELMAQRGDPDGLVAAKPLRPRGMRYPGQMNLWLGGVRAKSAQIGPGMAEWGLLRECYRRDYRALRDDAQAGRVPATLHRQRLAHWLRQFGLPADPDAATLREFIPDDLPLESPLRPQTTITESFPGSSATLGGDLTWTEVSQAWSNVSGEGSYDTTGATGFARAESDLSTDDMAVKCVVTVEGALSYGGPMARFRSTQVDGYHHNSINASNDYYCTRRSNGAGTDIITNELAGSLSLPRTHQIEVDGSDIEIFEGANSRGTASDSTHTGYTRAGVGWYTSSDGPQFDSWQANDLGPPPVGTLLLHPGMAGGMKVLVGGMRG